MEEMEVRKMCGILEFILEIFADVADSKIKENEWNDKYRYDTYSKDNRDKNNKDSKDRCFIDRG